MTHTAPDLLTITSATRSPDGDALLTFSDGSREVVTREDRPALSTMRPYLLSIRWNRPGEGRVFGVPLDLWGTVDAALSGVDTPPTLIGVYGGGNDALIFAGTWADGQQHALEVARPMWIQPTRQEPYQEGQPYPLAVFAGEVPTGEGEPPRSVIVFHVYPDTAEGRAVLITLGWGDWAQ